MATRGFELKDVQKLFGGLGKVRRLRGFTPRRAPLDRDQMSAIVADAERLLTDYYVHLPLKRALYGIDPLTRLRLLRTRVAERRPMDRSRLRLTAEQRLALDREEEAIFHAELTAIFTSLRDLHTIYVRPEPYRGMVAFLPFLIERCDDGNGGERYLLSKVATGLEDRPYAPRGRELEVTHWNGVPIRRAIDRFGELNAGTNPAARRARGLERLTFRWLGLGPQPDEDWVVVTYRDGRSTREVRFPWLVVRHEGPQRGGTRRSEAETADMADRRTANDVEGDWLDLLKVGLFGGGTDKVTYRHVGRTHGYLRIHSFAVDDERPEAVGEFVARVKELLEDARPGGLVIDIRDNPGGDIGVAELLLQLISPVKIQPEGLQFLNTDAADRLAEYVISNEPDGYLQRTFLELLGDARATGAAHTRSPSIEPLGAYNEIGQVYQGPVALLVDALTYSASDVFAAGFQDHKLGPVLGTDPQTGGGGGNPWTREDIYGNGGVEFEPLPRQATFDVTVRRTTRVRDRDGLALEDLGVRADDVLLPTSRDVLGKNQDLIGAAIRQLRVQDARLGVSFDAGAKAFTLEARGLDRVEVYVDDEPVATVTKARLGEPIQLNGHEPGHADFIGYVPDEPRPAVSRRWSA